MLISSVCTSTQLKTPLFQQWMPTFRHPPMMLHRKLWEWAYIAQALSERGMLQPGKRGLGFAVGKEPLAAVFANKGCEIVATDLGEAEALAAGWATTNQHAQNLAALNEARICAEDEFARRVSFRVVDMNDIPEDLTGFDFIWSSCAIEHLGSIDATIEFLSRSMACLRPGGIAVHTTEYNLSSDEATVEHGITVILRRRDLQRAKAQLEAEGHRVAPLDFEIGEAPDDQVVLSPPYTGQPCLKIWLGEHAVTSVGLVVEAGSSPPAARRSNASGHASRRQFPDLVRTMRAWLTPDRKQADRARSEPACATPVDRKGPLADIDDVRYAYRLLLGREPDVEGLASHVKLAEAKRLSPTGLAEAFIGCEEFVTRRSSSMMPLEVPLDGYSVFVRPVDHDVGWSVRETKSYEPHVTALVRESLQVGQTFVDVGANIGFFTAMAAHIVGARGKVAAIEPMDKNVQLISATVWRNAFAHVEILPFAASDRDALLPIATGSGTSNGQIVLGTPSAGLPMLFAQARRMDDMLRDLRSLDLLKIDIEGHELLALRGFTEGLARHRPSILTEFHPRCMRDNAGIEPAEYLAFLFAYGEQIEVLHTDGERVVCETPDAVMREWEKTDTRLDSHGTTHLDLYVRPSH